MGARGQPGVGTSATKASRVWFTLREGQLTERYYLDLSHPFARAGVHGRRESGGHGVGQADGDRQLKAIAYSARVA